VVSETIGEVHLPVARAGRLALAERTETTLPARHVARTQGVHRRGGQGMLGPMVTDVSSPLQARFVLCRPTHPGNIGAAARAIKVMGFHELALVSPNDPLGPEARARASGAVDVLEGARVTETLAEAVADCAWIVGLSARGRHEGPPPLALPQAVDAAMRRPQGERVAFVFGTERTGLSNEELLACHAVARIPTAADAWSLNLGAAVQVVAYELRRASLFGGLDATAVPAPERLRAATGATAEGATAAAPRGELDTFLGHAWELLVSLGTFRANDPRITLMRERLGRLLSKAAPTPEELKAAYGVLRWVRLALEGRAYHKRATAPDEVPATATEPPR